MDQTRPQDQTSLTSRLLSETFPEIQNPDFLEKLSDDSHQLLRKILSITPFIISAVDSQGIVTLSEGGGLTRLGFEPGEWVGKSIFAEFADDPELIDLFQRTLQGEKHRHVRTVGEQTLDVEYTPLYNDQQEIAGFLTVAVDISEKVASQEELRRSEERFSTIFQVNPIAMCITEIDTGIFIEVNENFLTALQCTREEILGKSAFDIGFWPSKETRRQMIEQVKSEGTARELYFDFIIPNGTRLCTMLSAVQIYFRGETFLLSCVKDVTRERAALDELEKLNENLEARVAARTAELQQAHASLNEEYTKRNRLYRALQQTEARWRSLVTNAPDTILTLDIDGTILYLNHPLADRAMEEIIGSSIYQFLPAGDIQKARTILKQVFQTGKPQ